MSDHAGTVIVLAKEPVAGRVKTRLHPAFTPAYAGMMTASNITPSGPDGENPLLLEVSRWSGPADAVDMLVVARCEPPVIDLGCGPGRMVRALTESGRAALGVDMSSVAVGLSMARGGLALRRRIFDEPFPAEGRWGTALLMDTNVGLGGDVAHCSPAAHD